jgi:hypothetical protein
VPLGKLRQRDWPDAPLPKRITQRCERYVETDLVSEAEAVDRRLSHALRLHIETLELVW